MADGKREILYYFSSLKSTFIPHFIVNEIFHFHAKEFVHAGVLNESNRRVTVRDFICVRRTAADDMNRNRQFKNHSDNYSLLLRMCERELLWIRIYFSTTFNIVWTVHWTQHTTHNTHREAINV